MLVFFLRGYFFLEGFASDFDTFLRLKQRVWAPTTKRFFGHFEDDLDISFAIYLLRLFKHFWFAIIIWNIPLVFWGVLIIFKYFSVTVHYHYLFELLLCLSNGNYWIINYAFEWVWDNIRPFLTSFIWFKLKNSE